MTTAEVGDIEEYARGVFQVRIPIPTPLRDVNCYLIKGSDGWAIVDTGFADDAATAAWQYALRKLNVNSAFVRHIFPTHYHPDHYGAAGLLQQMLQAEVLMHEQEAALARRIWQQSFTPIAQNFVRRQGLPEPLVDRVLNLSARFRHQVQPPSRVTTVKPGRQVLLGDREFEVICLPGHTPGLIVLWDPVDRLLLANDMVLDPISPNISAGPFAGPDPLADYLHSLRQLAPLPARLTLTGHRLPVNDLARRCAELARHHRDRLEQVTELVSRGQDQTAWTICRQLFVGRLRSTANINFALGETTAHLDHLVQRGCLTSRNITVSDGLSVTVYNPRG